MPDERQLLVKRFYEVTGHLPSEVARHLGMSIRTAQRWRLGTGVALTPHMQKLAVLASKHDPQLATDIYDHLDNFHRSQGMPLPSRPDRNGVRSEPGSRLAEAAIGAAAEVLHVSHAKMRPALRAALMTAKKGGATLESLIVGIERSDPG